MPSLFALLAVLPVLGLLSGVFAGLFGLNLARRGFYFLTAVGCAAGAALGAVLWWWSGSGFQQLGVPFDSFFFDAWLVMSPWRFSGACLFFLVAVCAFLILQYDRNVQPRPFLFALPVLWGLSLWFSLIADGVVRSLLLVLIVLCMFLLALRMPGVRHKDGAQLFQGLLPLFFAGCVLVVAELVHSAGDALRLAVSLVFLFGIPLPGLFGGWKDGFQPGVFAACLTSIICGVVLLGPHVYAPLMLVPLVLTSLVCGVAAAVSNNVNGIAFYAAVGLFHQYSGLVFLGAGRHLLHLLFFYALFVFGLWTLPAAVRGSDPDIRFRRKTPAPRWIRLLLGLLLLVFLGGVAPGMLLNLRLKVFAGIALLGSYAPVFYVLSLIGTCFLLLAGMRLLAQFSGFDNAEVRSAVTRKSVPAGVWIPFSVFGVLLIASLLFQEVPGIKEHPFLRFSFPYLVLLPFPAAALIWFVTPRGEKVVRLWSHVSPRFERRVCFFSSFQALALALSSAARFFCLVDRRLVKVLFLPARLLSLAGAGLRFLERRPEGIVFWLLTLWGMCA